MKRNWKRGKNSKKWSRKETESEQEGVVEHHIYAFFENLVCINASTLPDSRQGIAIWLFGYVAHASERQQNKCCAWLNKLPVICSMQCVVWSMFDDVILWTNAASSAPHDIVTHYGIAANADECVWALCVWNRFHIRRDKLRNRRWNWNEI